MFKIRECVQAAGVWEAAEGGGPRRKGDGRCRSFGRSLASRVLWSIMNWEEQTTSRVSL